MLRASALAFVAAVSLVAGCDVLNGLLAPPPIDDGGGRPGGGGGGGGNDDCDDDGDCRGGEFCNDDGECEDIDGGEGEEGEGEGPPPPPECNGAGCPEILSLTTNRSTLDERGSATISAVVTDPDGVADVIGGVLLDPVSNDTYGSFFAASAGAFQISVSWNELNPVRRIEFNGSTSRTVRARFFDQAGNEAFADVAFTLACSEAETACDAQCGAERCGGACVSDFSDDDNCGSCGHACNADAFCEFDENDGGFTCFCDRPPCDGGAEGEGEGEGGVPGEPFSGTRENGVVCGAAGTCPDVCCVDFLSQSSSCVASTDQCPFGGATCDGPEDCSVGEECCFAGFGATCTPTGDCRDGGNREVCVNSNDCAFGELCCSSSTVTAFGGDAGVCAEETPEGGCPNL